MTVKLKTDIDSVFQPETHWFLHPYRASVVFNKVSPLPNIQHNLQIELNNLYIKIRGN